MRSAISEALEDDCFRIEAPRIFNAKSLARELLAKAVESDENMEKFDSFSEKLLVVIRATSKDDKRWKMKSTKRKKMWSSFHKARMDTLPSLWTSLMSSFGVKNDDTL